MFGWIKDQDQASQGFYCGLRVRPGGRATWVWWHTPCSRGKFHPSRMGTCFVPRVFPFCVSGSKLGLSFFFPFFFFFSFLSRLSSNNSQHTLSSGKLKSLQKCIITSVRLRDLANKALIQTTDTMPIGASSTKAWARHIHNAKNTCWVVDSIMLGGFCREQKSPS